MPAYIQRADNTTLASMLANGQSEELEQPYPERLPRYGLIYERQGLRMFKRAILERAPVPKEEIQVCFQTAYTCWRALAFLPDSASPTLALSQNGLSPFMANSADDLLPAELVLAFRLSIAGLLGSRTAETRLDLRKFELTIADAGQVGWREYVAEHLFSAFVRLVRKDKGWEDIQQAIQSIKVLRLMQQHYEETYLKSLHGPERQSLAALELAGLYYLAQLVITVGEYLQSGQPEYEQVMEQINTYYGQASQVLEDGQLTVVAYLADLLWAGCCELTQNAIWTHVSHLGEHVQRYVQLLTSSVRDQPVIELWPSQQEAFRRHVLDAHQRAILVEMPTSAGKTLLAKFAIVQTKALHPQGLIVYVVPTRALVNQVTSDLRIDFRQLLVVEQAVPVFELDPTEERLLNSHIDVLVTTPEKLDLLVRREHPIVNNIILVVADEAHNINDEERGARLELLLGTIKRDFATARFLLLSPFLPNPQDLIQWLGSDQALPPISIDWKPNRKLVGTVQCVRDLDGWKLEFETCQSAHAMDIKADMKIGLGQYPARLTSIYALSKATIHALVKRGSILVLCKGPGTTARRARQIADERPLLAPSPVLDAVCHYIEAELGSNCELVYCLRHGVAYHHRGLSHETRWLLEFLIRDSIVNVVCGTTTLAQGINFPITTVIIETLGKGRSAKLTFQDFWNVAGRAGRTLVDTLGVVAFPAPDKNRREEVTEFLKSDAEAIASQLAELIERAEMISTEFNLQSLREHPQLSPLLQFLAHAMRVSGKANLAVEVEQILQDSLVYHQVQKHDQAAARRLVQICQAYMEQTLQHRNILKLADRTGIATPSVLSLLAQKGQSLELSQAENWLPERLFGEDLEPLIERLQVVAQLPEIHFEQIDQRFEVRRTAEILRDWVNGKTVEEMATIYGGHVRDKDKQVADFSNYLFSILNRASWGISALQTVCLSSDETINWNTVGYVPSMIFFGVRQKDAVWLRMVGVPRIVANRMASLWQQRMVAEPISYDLVRSWVAQLSDQDWRQVIPAGTTLTPSDMRIIWQVFSGR
ncbi:DEAD/DEAH box helicase [Dictyobacter kobayashii]|uniref:DEAD/DEAH box helicase n=1 Tax=Dictyobacter kobayashii TaxID=2014872 RepID=UPI0010A9740B|nr:DEAD/DEAH box helicase [Dictyobacter kobayashii]